MKSGTTFQSRIKEYFKVRTTQKSWIGQLTPPEEKDG